MEKIGKSHNIVHLFKEVIKGRHPDLIVTDDIEVLNIAIAYNYEIPYLLYSYEENFLEKTQLMLNQLINKANEVYEISNSTYQTIQTKENHAGIIAIIKLKSYQFQDLKDFIFVLDRLELPGNIGTIYRTLDACKATGVILVDPITKPNNLKITSSARGTNLIIPTVCSTYDEALTYLQNNNYDIYLGEPKLGKNYQQYEYQNKIAIVVGNERFGINEDWYNHQHLKVFIPMAGNNNSLNVSVAASILAYEAAMKRNNFPK